VRRVQAARVTMAAARASTLFQCDTIRDTL